MVWWAPRLPPAFSDSGVGCGRVCWARVSAVSSPSWLGCRGVFFALFFSFVFLFFFFPGFVVPVPPSPFFRGGLVVPPFFFFPFRCPFSPWAAVTGLVLPVLGGWSPCASVGVLSSVPSGGGSGRLWWCWLAVWRLWAVSVPFLPPPSFFFWGGGGACLFLLLPSPGWRSNWPAFSVVFRAVVFSCVLCGRVPAPWVGWAMYTVGSAPLLAGFGPGSAGWAAAPGGCLWFWVRGLGLFVSFPPLRCRLYSSGWSATVVAWRAVAPCVACGAGVWRVGAAPSRVCGGWLRLVPQVRVSCVVLCRSVPRRVSLYCGALHCGALWCGVPWSRVVPRWVSGGQPGLCCGAECGPECGRLVVGGCG